MHVAFWERATKRHQPFCRTTFSVSRRCLGMLLQLCTRAELRLPQSRGWSHDRSSYCYLLWQLGLPLVLACMGLSPASKHSTADNGVSKRGDHAGWEVPPQECTVQVPHLCDCLLGDGCALFNGTSIISWLMFAVHTLSEGWVRLGSIFPPKPQAHSSFHSCSTPCSPASAGNGTNDQKQSRAPSCGLAVTNDLCPYTYRMLAPT